MATTDPMNTITSDAERLEFEAWATEAGFDLDRQLHDDPFCPDGYKWSRTGAAWRAWQAARSSPGAGLRLVPEVPNESVLLFLMGGLVEPQEADEMQDEITQEEADAINDRCRTDARLHYAEILNIATKDAA